MALLVYQSELHRLLNELNGRATWLGIAIVPAVAVVLGILAAAFLAAALRRFARWLTALKHQRMLNDPRQAALVPPLPSHLQSLTPTLGRQIWQACGYLLFAAAMVGGAALIQYAPPGSGDDPEDRFLAWPIAVFLLLGSLYGLVDAVLRWRRARRAAQASRATGLSTDEQKPAVAGEIPALTVSFVVPPSVSRELRVVTAERNVFGRPPWNIVYLRLFDNEDGLQRFLKACWRQCGYVHFIRDVDSVTSDELRAIEDGSRVFIESRERLLADLDARPGGSLPTGERTFDGITAEPVEVDDVYGSYPVYAALCQDSFWKAAVDVLLERADVVLLDLSGYHWDNLGTGYELQRVIDRFPIDRCVFITAHHHTDEPFLEAQIQRVWSQMAAGSPNAGNQPRRVILAHAAMPGERTDRALAWMLQQRLETVESYKARINNLSERGSVERARREAARQQAAAARRGKAPTALRFLLRWWGVPGF